MRLKENSPAVLAHIATLQGVIQRMAGNSAACKTWTLTIVSGIIAISPDKSDWIVWTMALVPSLFMSLLDTNYLALERGFRGSHKIFIQKLHDDSIEIKDLFQIVPIKISASNRWTALCSFSIVTFYAPLLVILVASNPLLHTAFSAASESLTGICK